MSTKNCKTSAVWNHFNKTSNEYAICNKFSVSLKCSENSTSGLLRHLDKKHGIRLLSAGGRAAAATERPGEEGNSVNTACKPNETEADRNRCSLPEQIKLT